MMYYWQIFRQILRPGAGGSPNISGGDIRIDQSIYPRNFTKRSFLEAYTYYSSADQNFFCKGGDEPTLRLQLMYQKPLKGSYY